MAQKVTGPRRWIPVVLLLTGGAVFLTPQLGRVVRSAQESSSNSVVGIISALAFVLVFTAALVGWFVVRTRQRRSHIAANHPGARQLQFTPSKELAEAARKLDARVSTSAYGTMIAFDGRLKLFIGGGETPRIDLPLDAVVDVSVGETLLGVRWTPSIDITVSTPDGPAKLPIAPIPTGNIFRTLTAAELETLALQLRQEIAEPA